MKNTLVCSPTRVEMDKEIVDNLSHVIITNLPKPQGIPNDIIEKWFVVKNDATNVKIACCKLL